MPVISELQQRGCVGGGYGTKSDPYMEEEYIHFLASGYFPGGFVLFGGDTNPTNLCASYGSSGAESVSYNPYTLIKANIRA